MAVVVPLVDSDYARVIVGRAVIVSNANTTRTTGQLWPRGDGRQ